jgi:hypothetical protein
MRVMQAIPLDITYEDEYLIVINKVRDQQVSKCTFRAALYHATL